MKEGLPLTPTPQACLVVRNISPYPTVDVSIVSISPGEGYPRGTKGYRSALNWRARQPNQLPGTVRAVTDALAWPCERKLAWTKTDRKVWLHGKSPSKQLLAGGAVLECNNFPVAKGTAHKSSRTCQKQGYTWVKSNRPNHLNHTYWQIDLANQLNSYLASYDLHSSLKSD